jgi:hypothetical protein
MDRRLRPERGVECSIPDDQTHEEAHRPLAELSTHLAEMAAKCNYNHLAGRWQPVLSRGAEYKVPRGWNSGRRTRYRVHGTRVTVLNLPLLIPCRR